MHRHGARHAPPWRAGSPGRHAGRARYVVLRSGWEWELPTQPTDFRANSILGNIAAAMRWIAEGHVTVDGLATVAPPESAQEAYQALLDGTAARLGFVFGWNGG